MCAFSAEKQRRSGSLRTVYGARGLLQGRAACVRCGKSVQSDRHRGLPMYRERHAGVCDTNEHAVMAHSVDTQIGTILQALELPVDIGASAWPD